MSVRQSLRFVGATILATACSSSTSDGLSPFFSPGDIAVSAKTVSFPGRDTQIAYIADREGGTVSVLDLKKEKLLDTDPGDDFDATPLVVGGQPSALAIDDRGDLPVVYVADAQTRKLVAYALDAAEDEPREFLSHLPVDLGGALEGRVSKPIFIDRDRDGSYEFIPDLAFTPSEPGSEAWKLTYRGSDKGYEVEGSVSGLQDRFATENQSYETDDGDVSFTVVQGETTRGKDLFYFGTAGVEPLGLTGSPQDLRIEGNELYVVTSDPAEVVVFDLDTQSVTGTATLSDGGPDPIPGRSAILDGHLYVSNRANATLFDVDLDTLAVSVRTTPGPTTSILAIDSDTLLLSYRSEKKAGFFSLLDDTTDELTMSDVPTHACTYELDGKSYALVPNLSAFADVIDLSTRKRVDRSNRSGSESFEDNLEFFDDGEVSAPEMISIATRDGRTLTERWQLIYEGVLPQTQGLEGTVTGDLVTLASGSWTQAGVAAGDRMVLDRTEEVEILEVQSSSVLRLASSPSHQGIQSLFVRSHESYVAVGSESGVQSNRVKENIAYESDHSEIKLKIRSSVVDPTTRGDFFTFSTFDGVNPIAMTSGGIDSHALCVTPPGSTDPKGFVTRQSLGSVSVIKLTSLRQSKSIR